MKKVKKLVSLLLAVVMLTGLTVCGGVVADGGTASLEITDTTSGYIYSIYKVLDVTISGTGTEATYSYTVPDEWVDFFWDSTESQTASAVSSYVTVTKVNDVYYVTWNETASTSTSSMQTFAGLIAGYIEDEGITATASNSAAGDTLTFSSLDLGYYYVKSGVGTLVDLDTVDGTTEVVDKNAKPTIEKEVSSDGETYDGDSTTDLTKTVYYQVTITGIDEITTLVLHDNLPDGFKLDDNSVTVTLYTDANTYTTLATSTDYTFSTDTNSCQALTGESSSVCDFEIDFSNLLAETTSGNYYTYVLSASDPDEAYIVVSYTASVDTDKYSSLVIGGSGNINTAAITTNATEQKEADTETYTYDLYVYKYTADSASSTPGTALEGAKFVLYYVDDTSSTTYYARLSTDGYLTAWVTSLDDATELTTDSYGLVHFIGLDNGTYYILETEAPDGYSKVSSATTITIENGSVTSTTITVSDGTENVSATAIYNSTSSEMPSTGGIGTTIFYVVGGILVVGAVILLITKKRMKDDE